MGQDLEVAGDGIYVGGYGRGTVSYGGQNFVSSGPIDAFLFRFTE